MTMGLREKVTYFHTHFQLICICCFCLVPFWHLENHKAKKPFWIDFGYVRWKMCVWARTAYPRRTNSHKHNNNVTLYIASWYISNTHTTPHNMWYMLIYKHVCNRSSTVYSRHTECSSCPNKIHMQTFMVPNTNWRIIKQFRRRQQIDRRTQSRERE